jgi:glutamate N-acetyltransferase/amino-acid N-acetyltransferase
VKIEFDPGGSVTSPVGFTAGVAACGFKNTGALDLALLVSSEDCRAAGVFTQNQVVAAPVIVDRETLADHAARIRCVVVNAGVANACTGQAGLDVARETQSFAARQIGCEPEQVLVLSTGVIGASLDMQCMKQGIEHAVGRCDADNGVATAEAIMTTDTKPKHASIRVELPDGVITLGGIAKGAGMIHPNLGTMLAVLTTDASVPLETLRKMLADSTNRSFNRISVDGDTSTNDSVLLMANGSSGIRLETASVRRAFKEALDQLCLELAQAIVRDAEGATKFINLHITGAQTEADALKVGHAIVTSPLVKTAIAGGDPNWGRILAAAGRAGVLLNPDQLSLWIASKGLDEIQLVEGGAALALDMQEASVIFSTSELTIRLDLGMGGAGATLWTCDLTTAYVQINSEYHT